MAVARKRLQAVTSPSARRGDPEVTDARRRYAECRVLGHSWRHTGRLREAEAFGTYGFESTCDHCTTVRVKYVGVSGTTVKARYHYPSEYSQKGEDKLNGTQWRRVLLRSLDD